MTSKELLAFICLAAPAALMFAAALLSLSSTGRGRVRQPSATGEGGWERGRAAWQPFCLLSGAALLAAASGLVFGWLAPQTWSRMAGRLEPWFAPTALASMLAVLVQFLGTVIAAFSARYLEGEPNQERYRMALALVLGDVQLLLLADHWIVLIVAWSQVGWALEALLCFYPDRPFALLAAHKKRLADRAADVLLVVAAGLAWQTVGSLSLSTLWLYVAHHALSGALEATALCVALAVALRTALLPVHGWIIQVMEAPTPVSALLHAGVVNLGGFVLIRFAPLFAAVPAAQTVLSLLGLLTALLAGLVMLTRISIKVHLAWSTVAQMGFMVLECGVGLPIMAALHLLGHSLYKSHSFLASAGIVRRTQLAAFYRSDAPGAMALLVAPVFATLVVAAVERVLAGVQWPVWWSVILALAWAPLLWVPRKRGRDCSRREQVLRFIAGAIGVALLTAGCVFAHDLPFGFVDRPVGTLGWTAAAGLSVLYLGLVLLILRPTWMRAFRRAAYAGFYLDEVYTRAALSIWPGDWAPAARAARSTAVARLSGAPIPTEL